MTLLEPTYQIHVLKKKFGKKNLQNLISHKDRSLLNTYSLALTE